MKIHFKLGWVKSGKAGAKTFKSQAAYEIFFDYAQRISKFAPCEISGFDLSKGLKETASKLWICDRGVGANILSSEALALKLEKTKDSGDREILILIGGADGFSEQEFNVLKPDLRWSFGPMTLPHELAAVVASEQIYRAFSIIHRLPYHMGH